MRWSRLISAVGIMWMCLGGAKVRAEASMETTILGRQTIEVDGVICEFSPGRESLARALAERFVIRNREAVAFVAALPNAADSEIPLSPADMREHRSEYMAAICAQLALSAPTAWQEECYDAFLNYYETHMLLLGQLRRFAAMRVAKLDRITLWDRVELVRRLESGEELRGFSYDPVTKKGRASFALPEMNFEDERFAKLNEERQALIREYSFNIKPGADGGSNYSASASSRHRSPAQVETAKLNLDPKPKEGNGNADFPMVIPTELAESSDAEIIEQLWQAGGLLEVESFKDFLNSFAGGQRGFDPAIASLVFHETVEVGVVEHYYQGKDRRWFCDGVANYVPWRIVRDRHGSELANQVYNLAAQLAQYRDVADRVNLQSWAAVERQDNEDQESRMNSANYAFAARVIFLMHERQGDDVLPRLFKEVGRTKPSKVTFKTFEKAWKKISGDGLRQLMDEASRLP